MKFIKILPVYFYEEESGASPVLKWLKDLSKEDRKIIGNDIKVIQNDWSVAIGTSVVKSLGKSLWEVRSKLDNRIARILFFIDNGEIILLNGFIKKTQKTPIQEIDLAIKRMKNYKRVYEK
jgi:phage-related protein